MTEPETWWRDAVGPEWSGHTWAALEAALTPTLYGAGPAGLVAEARAWADEPANVLYVRSASLRRAYGFAVSVAQRAARTMAAERGFSRHLLAVGVLDELSMPADPDPAATAEAQSNPRRQQWTSADTRRRLLDEYAKPLERADLTLLRLPPQGDAEQVLDQIADRRRNYLRPTILAGVVLPHDFPPRLRRRHRVPLRFPPRRRPGVGQTDRARSGPATLGNTPLHWRLERT